MQQLAKNEKDPGAEPQERKNKRKARPDLEHSAPRPRKLFVETPSEKKDVTDDEDDDNEDRDDIPTPTSSACGSDGEDEDIFQGKYAGFNAPKPAQESAQPDYATPVQKKSRPQQDSSKQATKSCAATASSVIDSWPEELRDMLATLDDKLLASLPNTWTRPEPNPVSMSCSHVAQVLLSNMCMPCSTDFGHVLNILTEEAILTYGDAVECFLASDCI